MPNAFGGTLSARNPATEAELGRIETTSPGAVDDVVRIARRAQISWRETSWRERKAWLERWAAGLARESTAWAEAIVTEIGKPRGEAMAEVVTSLDAIRWTARYGGRVLADQRLGAGHQRWMLIPAASVRQRPFGVIGMIGTWNYPLFLNAPAIAQALAAGNAVVWKPSELASLVGQRLQHSFEVSGLPSGLVGAIYGGAQVGQALVESAVDKGMFTGGIENGRRVLGALASRGIPALAELSGFDPALVLPDAQRQTTLRSLTWAAFVGSGQTCVSVKRVLVVGDPGPWAEDLARIARSLRIGDPGSPEVDLGPLISEEGRARFDGYIRAAVDAGARLLAGAEPRPDRGWYARPTVLLADSPAAESALEGVFGPVILVRGLPDVDTAVDAANSSRFGLAASVWGRDLRVARAVAARIEAGQVTVNDAVTPTGHASAPFGGVKASGHGRIKGTHGLLEFVQSQALFVRRHGGFRPQGFPYSAHVERMLGWYLRLFHGRG